MPTVRIRLISNADDAAAMITLLHGLNGIEHVQEVADLMPHMDDADSSSAGLPDDIGPGIHAIEIQASGSVTGERVRDLAERAAESLGATVEFVDEF